MLLFLVHVTLAWRAVTITSCRETVTMTINALAGTLTSRHKFIGNSDVLGTVLHLEAGGAKFALNKNNYRMLLLTHPASHLALRY